MEIITQTLVKALLPPRPDDAHKGSFGRLLNIAGSLRYPGAAALSTLAASRCGAGLVTLAAPKSVASGLFSKLTSSTFLPLSEENGVISPAAREEILSELKNFTACLIGCGLLDKAMVLPLLKAVLNYTDCPVIIDADGINSLQGNIDILSTSKAPVVLTPHPAEMSRITGIPVDEILSAPMRISAEYAKKLNVIIVLKLHETFITSPAGTVYSNRTGNSGMAKGGSGDVLAGIIASLCAQGAAPLDAAVCGVYIHGNAGDRAAEKYSNTAMLPEDIIGELGYIFKDLET